jgi:hypothetical protein
MLHILQFESRTVRVLLTQSRAAGVVACLQEIHAPTFADRQKDEYATGGGFLKKTYAYTLTVFDGMDNRKNGMTHLGHSLVSWVKRCAMTMGMNVIAMTNTATTLVTGR